MVLWKVQAEIKSMYVLYIYIDKLNMELLGTFFPGNYCMHVGFIDKTWDGGGPQSSLPHWADTADIF